MKMVVFCGRGVKNPGKGFRMNGMETNSDADFDKQLLLFAM